MAAYVQLAMAPQTHASVHRIPRARHQLRPVQSCSPAVAGVPASCWFGVAAPLAPLHTTDRPGRSLVPQRSVRLICCIM